MQQGLRTIHVALLGEGTPAWRPTQARHIEAFTYELLGTVPDDEEWQFKPGQLVECHEHVFAGGGSGLVALRALPPNNSFKPKPLRGSA
jgi:hypothetical protein